MAKLVPPFVSEDTSSNAERKIFDLLKRDTTIEGWYVLHSLSLSRDRSSRPYGEIDFVFLVPEYGILCLEVKGGGISTTDGNWFTTGTGGIRKPLKASPFHQARISMYTLKNRLDEIFKNEGKSFNFEMVYAVAFPDCLCPPVTPEFTRNEVIDARDLSEPIGKVLKTLVTRRFTRNGSGLPASRFNSEDLKFVRSVLRPDFDRSILLKTVLNTSESQICRFTEEQLLRLEELEDNPRCIFDGPAGTGKTVLAVHYAKRLAADGKRTLLLCFNRILGKSLRAQVADTPFLKAGSFFSLLYKLVQKSEFAEEYRRATQLSDDFERSQKLLEFARLAIIELDYKFDALVVDEAQDLATVGRLEVLDDLVLDGLRNGKWAMFGDFTQQILFEPDAAVENIERYTPAVTKARLVRNCRNTRQIARTAISLSNLSNSLYRGEMSDGSNVQFLYYRDTEEAISVLSKVVGDLTGSGIDIGDIVLLSPLKMSNGLLRDCRKIAGHDIVDLTDLDNPLSSGRKLKFSTISAFKGMESSVAIIFDFHTFSKEICEPLLYVGLTRPRSHLIVLSAEKNRQRIAGLNL